MDIMNKLIILSILSFCVVIIHAQDNISVSIEKTLIDNQIIAIKTTLTNNNDGAILIPIKSLTDDNGNNLSGGSTYLTLNAYDINNKKVSVISRAIYYQYDPKYPLYNNPYRIVLKKGESIQKIAFVGSFQGVEGFLPADCVFKYLEIKLHIKYFYLLDDSIHIKDLISNRIEIF